jgi:Glycolipid 2-alpha-mannosyltransferase
VNYSCAVAIHLIVPPQPIGEMLILFIIIFLAVKLSGGNTCIPGNGKSPGSSVVTASATRWAIVALAQEITYDQAFKRNEYLAQYLRRFHSPTRNVSVIMFGENLKDAAVIDSWRAQFRGIAPLNIVDTRKFLYPAANPIEALKLGYNYMCRFFAVEMYEYLKHHFDYYWRIDTDCFLTRLDYDIFQWTIDKNVEYGYFSGPKLGSESHKLTAEAIPTWVAQYMKNCSIKEKSLLGEPLQTPLVMYNNMHIAKVSFFSRPDVMHFLRSVEQSGYILSHRWGDATIQTYALRLFQDEVKIQLAPNMEYIHGSHRVRVANGTSTYIKGLLQMVLSGKYKPLIAR